MSSDRLTIDIDTVRRLVADQFPQWSGLAIRRVAVDGWDNATFHLGDSLKIRMPTAPRYVAQVDKEARILPVLQRLLSHDLPQPIATGVPGHGYPFAWSVQSFIDGETVADSMVDKPRLAVELAEFLLALHRVPTVAGPRPGPHNFYRGGSLSVYGAETLDCLAKSAADIDTVAAGDVWRTALASQWQAAPVWVHGDISPGNLLLRDGRLSAVIDFGCCGIGDPACDLIICWTFFDRQSRDLFRANIDLDHATWQRARGWALWKMLLKLTNAEAGPVEKAAARRVIAQLIDEHLAIDKG